SVGPAPLVHQDAGLHQPAHVKPPAGQETGLLHARPPSPPVPAAPPARPSPPACAALPAASPGAAGSSPYDAITARIRCWFSGDGSHSGGRQTGLILPIWARTHFRGPGLVSRNSASFMGSRK